jgi:FixJ family two-component response regulator
MNDARFTVFLVDDDDAVLRALSRRLRIAGYEVRTYASPHAFLAEHNPNLPGCAVLDVTMPGLDGLELQAALASSEPARQVIFLTGTGDIPTTVRAMKAGAVDFLTKPATGARLIAAVENAASRDRANRRSQDEVTEVRARISSLSRRESEVLGLVVAGRLNKQIADELGLSIKTIKTQRGLMMRKMRVRSVADLVRLTEIARRGSPSTGEAQ